MNIKIFKKYVANFIITLVILSIFSFVLFADKLSTTSANPKGAMYCGNSKNSVSLMFNVYQGEEYLDSILNSLKKYNFKTTFFVGGIFASKKPEYIKKIHDSKNEIANHGFFHKNHQKLNYKQNCTEIENTHKLIKNLINYDMTLFAPPSGAFNLNTIDAVKSLGYKTIMWTRDTIDWRDQDVDLIFRRATKNIKAGDWILMHPTKATAEALDKVLEYIVSKNLIVDTVSNTMTK